MTCPFCKHKILYTLQNNYKKCAYCKKKFSVKKIETDLQIIEYFCHSINANKASSILNINYRTVKNRYNIFRKLIANYSENEYYKNNTNENSYDEFYYFTNRQKKNKNLNLFDSISIIGFYSNKKIFTLLMPKVKHENNPFDEEKYKNYLRWYRLSSKNAYSTPLKIFWKYLEENLKKYKGINEENFFLYLKECEFKFNHLQNKQIEILKNLYYT